MILASSTCKKPNSVSSVKVLSTKQCALKLPLNDAGVN